MKLPVVAIAFSLLIAPACSDERSPENHAVFLIVVDTLRPDRLSSYDYRGHRTPEIDRLSELGLQFDNAHSTSSWTVPSVASIMTSLFPSELGLVEAPALADRSFGIRERRDQQETSPPLEIGTIAEVLAAAGYRTAAFVNQPGLSTGFGFVQGFEDWYYTPKKGRVERLDTSVSSPIHDWPGSLSGAQISDRALTRAFGEWVAEHAEDRIFAWIHLLTPHRPYQMRVGGAATGKGGKQVDLQSHRYDGEVVLVDDLVGRVLSAIEEHVRLKRSTIIFASDHGEAFGEHGTQQHGHSLHGEVTRVPLIVVDPRLPAGRRNGTDVALLDVMPTILELSGLAESAPVRLRGESLVRVVANGRRSQAVYSEGMLYGSTERSYIEDGFKLMYDEDGGAQTLYELASDPHENSDLADLHADRRERLWTAMRSLRDDLEQSRADIRREADADETSREDGGDEWMRALEALGYVE